MSTRARATGLAVLSAVLFGASTPLSKVLLADLGGNTLAGLLYLGAALAVAPAVARRVWSGAAIVPSDRANRWRLAGAVALGGGLGPVLVLAALARAPAASVSLWLNLETLATAVLGVWLFREHLGRLGVVANLGVLVAGLALTFDGARIDPVPALLVAGGALCWGLDNHLTALIDGIRPEESTFFKGIGAGTVNLLLGATGSLPVGPVVGALAVGAVSYGASIVLYITAAQGLGATRAQMIFAAAPFVGVAGSVLLGEPLGPWQIVAGLLLLGANGLLAFERHEHEHAHPAEVHEHPHRHDDGHHAHVHPGLPASTWHTHEHGHAGATHSHRHLPDLHHRHPH